MKQETSARALEIEKTSLLWIFLRCYCLIQVQLFFFFSTESVEKRTFFFCCRGCKTSFFHVVENNKVYLSRRASVNRLCYLKLMNSFFDGEWGGVHMWKGLKYFIMSLLENLLILRTVFNTWAIFSAIVEFWGLIKISSYCASGLNRPGMEVLKPLHRRKSWMKFSRKFLKVWFACFRSCTFKG